MSAATDRGTTMRTKAEMHAMREMLGVTQQRMADDLGVKVLSVKRWESPRYDNRAPQDAWDYLDGLMRDQDAAVCAALERVDEVAAGLGHAPDEVVMPYWAGQRDYDDNHCADDGGFWTEANATSRRVATVLRGRDVRVRWVDGADNVVPRTD